MIRTLHAFGAVALLTVVLCGCGASMNIDVDYDPATVVAIGAYETYSWLPDPGGRDRRVNNEFVGQQVMLVADAVLAEKGYRRVEGDGDFMLGWHAGLRDGMDVTTINDYYGYGYSRWGYGGGVWVSDTYVDEYTEGTLLVDVVDAERNELVWRGSAETRVDPLAMPEDTAPVIRDAVQRILSDFPPDR
ncbi:MAG: DUF4136 domain-containing protein [Gemmatimonadota bacterium]|nr:DUF4136 domain-containing protein [Gemmatimonadota bacterium]